MKTDEYLTIISRCCLLHEKALLIQKPSVEVDNEIIAMLKLKDSKLFDMVSIIVKSFGGEKRKDKSPRTLHAYDVTRIALEGLQYLHPLILEKWSEKETQTVVLSSLGHDLFEDGIGIEKLDFAKIFSQEIRDIIVELTIPKQKTYEEGHILCKEKFNLFSVERTSLYPTNFLPEDHFQAPPSAIGAYVKLCDLTSSLEANIARRIPGWKQENYIELVKHFREIANNLSSLNVIVWEQFRIASQGLIAS